MNPPAVLRVSLGLALVHLGFRLIAAAVILTAVIFVVHVLFDFSWAWTPSYLYLGMVMILLALIPIPIVIGILVGVIGRLFCLRTPPELPTARARIRLAVLLEGCGLLTALVNAVVVWAIWTINGYPGAGGPSTVPDEVVFGVYLFAVVQFAAGQAFFYAFSVALAKAVGMKLVHRPSVAALVVIVTGSTVFAAAYSLAGTRGRFPSTLTEMLTAVGANVLALCVFGTLYVYGRHLRPLRAAIKEYNTRQPGS